MKQSKIYPLLLLALAMTSCSTYQYTARQTNVNQRSIGATEQMAGLTVNYDREVTATSDYQLTKKDAVSEAEFRCIQESKIDVVVDPMFKIEYNPFKLKKRFRATIIGFAGSYKEAPTRIEESKKYTLEEIEKYKLLYDPNFPQHYYQKAQIGDSFIFNGGKAYSAPKEEAKPASLLIQPISKKQQKAALMNNPFAIDKARKLRNAGIGVMAAGTALCLLVGLPVYMSGVKGEPTRNYNSWTGKWETNYNNYEPHTGKVVAGAVLMGIGAGTAVYAGVPIFAVGQARYNKLRKQETVTFSLNRTVNGIGLGLTF